MGDLFNGYNVGAFLIAVVFAVAMFVRSLPKKDKGDL